MMKQMEDERRGGEGGGASAEPRRQEALRKRPDQWGRVHKEGGRAGGKEAMHVYSSGARSQDPGPTSDRAGSNETRKHKDSMKKLVMCTEEKLFRP